MKIKLWGTRGSLSAPLSTAEYRAKLKTVLNRATQENLKPENIDQFIENLPINLSITYGGNTTCAEVMSPGGKRVIIDAGTGIRNLGDRLMQTEFGKGKGHALMLFTHTHWDHIQGLPFFKPGYIPGNKFDFYSPIDDLKERLLIQEDFRFFPAPYLSAGATKEFHKMNPGEVLEIEKGFKIDCYPLKHPGGSYAYRFRDGKHTIIFATDAEFTGNYLEQTDIDDSFFHDADVLILDAQYTLDESFQKFDWGHTSHTMAVNLAVRWRVKNLVMTHHEPAYSDAKLKNDRQQALEHREALGQKLPNLISARDGLTIRFKK